MNEVENVYRSENQKMWRSILAFSGDFNVASDSVSEAFAQALARSSEINDIKSWVWRTAYNLARGLLKKNSDKAELHDGQDSEYLDTNIVEILSLLDNLSEQQRVIVALRYIADLKPKDIAEIIGSSSSSVRVQLHRAHDSLRNDLTITGVSHEQ